MMSAANDMGRTYKRRKAVVISAHSPRYFNQAVVPKFERLNIDVLKVVDPNGEAALTHSDAPYVIILLELLDKALVKKVVRTAKDAGKRIITLHRQLSDWTRAFDDLEDQERDETPNSARPRVLSTAWTAPVPKSAEPELIEETEGVSDEYKSFLQMYEEENTALMAKLREAEASRDVAQTRLVTVSREAGEMAAKKSRLEDDLKVAREEITRLGQAVADAQSPAMVTSSLQYKQILQTANALRADLELSGRRAIESRTQISKLSKELEESQKSYEVVFKKNSESTKYLDDRLRLVKDIHDKEMERIQSDLLEAQTSLAQLKREYDGREMYIKNAQAEVNKSRDADKEIKSLKHTIKNLENEVDRLKLNRPLSPPGAPASSAAALKVNENFVKVRDAYKVLWKTGSMDAVEILQKLMEWEPKS
jgi:hypothetical protein